MIHVAVGVITNQRDEVLIALRHADSHQGGLWEFPGGKLEPGEDVQTALRRELSEELDIAVEPDRELIQVTFDYPEKTVLLDVWMISRFEGHPVGKEGQPVKWVAISELNPDLFPPANKPIIQALRDHAGLSSP